MSGHGWVTPNPNGVVARCGGPAICPVCQKEAAAAGWKPPEAKSEPIQWEVCNQCKGSGSVAFMPKCPGCGGRGKVPRTLASLEASKPPEHSPKEMEEMLGLLNTALMQAQLEKASLMNALTQSQGEVERLTRLGQAQSVHLIEEGHKHEDAWRKVVSDVMLALTERWDEALHSYVLSVSKTQWEAFKAFAERML